VIVWDDTEHPWTPPADHYVVNIDGLSVGIGWHYDQTTNIWTGPPALTANFSPAPIFLGQQTSLLWESQNVDTVVLSTNPGETFAANGSLGFTPSAIGKFSVTLTATGLAGVVITTASVNVVATQAELGA
jgi:hypothetical protein